MDAEVPKANGTDADGEVVWFWRLGADVKLAETTAVPRAKTCRENEKVCLLSSFRDAPLGAGPESIPPVIMFSTGFRYSLPKHQHGGYGFRARASRARNDDMGSWA